MNNPANSIMQYQKDHMNLCTRQDTPNSEFLIKIIGYSFLFNLKQNKFNFELYI